jgi:hypothetical protein
MEHYLIVTFLSILILLYCSSKVVMSGFSHVKMSAFERSGYFMKNRILSMNQKELDRAALLERLGSKPLSQAEAAQRLGLSTRQVRRLQASYHRIGAAGLASKRRGKPSNNTLKPPVKAQAICLVSELYRGFGPTLAHENLTEGHRLQLSVESLRKAMISANLWKGRPRRVRKAVQQMLTRRPCLGERVRAP